MRLAACKLIYLIIYLTVLGLYRSPSFKNTANFLVALDDLISDSNSTKQFIIAGDINIDILSDDVHSANISEYLCLMNEHGLASAITKPTRERACLDHIFVRSKFKVVGMVCDTDITDHKMVAVGITSTKPRPAVLNRRRSLTDFDGVAAELSVVNWAPVLEADDTNLALELFMTTFKSVVENNTREVILSRKKFTLKPWMTPGLLRCARHRDRLHLKARQNPNDEFSKVTYNRYKNYFNNLLRKLKHEYEQSLLLTHNKDPKRLWSTIRNICNIPKKPTQHPDLVDPSDPKQSLDKCNHVFSSAGKKLADKIFAQTGESEGTLAAKVNIGESPSESFFMHPTNASEIKNIISQLKTNSAPGLDGMGSDLIKSVGHLILQPLSIT